MEWVLGIFIAVMLALLVYSIASVSSDVRKKAQPSVDAFFEGLHSFLFRKQPPSKSNLNQEGREKKY